jgi:hypothetical protein
LADDIKLIGDGRDGAIRQLGRALCEPAIEDAVHVLIPVHASSPVAAKRESASMAARICCLA